MGSHLFGPLLTFFFFSGFRVSVQPKCLKSRPSRLKLLLKTLSRKAAFVLKLLAGREPGIRQYCSCSFAEIIWDNILHILNFFFHMNIFINFPLNPPHQLCLFFLKKLLVKLTGWYKVCFYQEARFLEASGPAEISLFPLPAGSRPPEAKWLPQHLHLHCHYQPDCGHPPLQLKIFEAISGDSWNYLEQKQKNVSKAQNLEKYFYLNLQQDLWLPQATLVCLR